MCYSLCVRVLKAYLSSQFISKPVQVSDLQQDVDKCKRDYLQIKMMADEEVILLRQQLVALRKAMASSEKERETIQKQLDKEVRRFFL